MPSYGKPYTRAEKWDPVRLGLSAVTLDAARTSNAFGISGMNQLVVEWTRTNNSGTATSFKFERSNDNGTTWRPITASSLSAGTDTLAIYTVSAPIATLLTGSFYMSLLGDFTDSMRIVVASNSDAADTVSFWVTIGVSG